MSGQSPRDTREQTREQFGRQVESALVDCYGSPGHPDHVRALGAVMAVVDPSLADLDKARRNFRMIQDEADRLADELAAERDRLTLAYRELAAERARFVGQPGPVIGVDYQPGCNRPDCKPCADPGSPCPKYEGPDDPPFCPCCGWHRKHHPEGAAQDQPTEEAR